MTPTKDDELIRVMWRQGRTQNAIALALGGGWTLGRVASRITALELRNTRPMTKNNHARIVLFKQASMALTSSVTPKEKAPRVSAGPVGFMELEQGMCRWPVGEATTTYCGGDVEAGRPYCPGHARDARQPPR